MNALAGICACLCTVGVGYYVSATKDRRATVFEHAVAAGAGGLMGWALGEVSRILTASVHL